MPQSPARQLEQTLARAQRWLDQPESEAEPRALLPEMERLANEVAQQNHDLGLTLVERAERLALAIAEQLDGPNSKEVDRLQYRLACTLQQRGGCDEAERLLSARLERLNVQPEASRTQLAHALYALLYHRVHFGPPRSDELLRKQLQHLADMVRSLPAVRRDLEPLVADLLCTLESRSDSKASQERALLGRVEAMRRTAGPRHPSYALELAKLGSFYTTQGQLDQAEQTLARALEIVTAKDTQAPEAGHVLLHWVELEEARGRFDQALARLSRAERLWRNVEDAPHDKLKMLRARLEDLCVQSQRQGPERLRHPTLGVGEVVERTGNKVRLRMQDGTERTILADRLQRV